MASAQVILPDKTVFRPEEVVRLTHLDGRVLNFWATEFEGIQPNRTESGENFYTRGAVERILQIKKWLVEERLDKATIRQRLMSTQLPEEEVELQAAPPPELGMTTMRTLSQIKQGLKEILTILDRDDRI